MMSIKYYMSLLLNLVVVRLCFFKVLDYYFVMVRDLELSRNLTKTVIKTNWENGN